MVKGGFTHRGKGCRKTRHGGEYRHAQNARQMMVTVGETVSVIECTLQRPTKVVTDRLAVDPLQENGKLFFVQAPNVVPIFMSPVTCVDDVATMVSFSR